MTRFTIFLISHVSNKATVIQNRTSNLFMKNEVNDPFSAGIEMTLTVRGSTLDVRF